MHDYNFNMSKHDEDVFWQIGADLLSIVIFSSQKKSILLSPGKYHHSEYEEKYEKHELFAAGFEGVDEYFESRRVPGQLEQPEDSNDWEKFQYVSILHILEKRASSLQSQRLDLSNEHCYFLI